MNITKIVFFFFFFLRNNKIITSRVGGIFRVGQVTPVQLFFFVA